MSSNNCCFLTYIQISQEAGQEIWYSHLLKNFPQFVVIHTVKGFGIVNESRQIGSGQTGDGKSERQHSKNQWNKYGLEWVNLTQMTIISTTVGKNPLEEME